jgi:hypothetical protein
MANDRCAAARAALLALPAALLLLAACGLAVVFVPSSFVAVQRFEERRAARRKPRPALAAQ